MTALLVSGMSGATSKFTVTAQTLAGWQTAGTEISALAGQDQMVLPAGAQLFRSFPAGLVAVHLICRPSFAGAFSECPLLQVGPVSMVFLRAGGGGKLLLVLDHSTPATLPIEVKLDEDGGSSQLLDIILSSDSARGLATATVSGDSFSLDLGSASEEPVSVALSSGTRTAWPLASMEVTVTTPDNLGAPDDTVGSADGVGGTATAPEHSSAASPAWALTTSNTGNAISATGSGASGGKNSPASPKSAPTFEVFTPPSVRRGTALSTSHGSASISTAK